MEANLGLLTHRDCRKWFLELMFHLAQLLWLRKGLLQCALARLSHRMLGKAHTMKKHTRAGQSLRKLCRAAITRQTSSPCIEKELERPATPWTNPEPRSLHFVGILDIQFSNSQNIRLANISFLTANSQTIKTQATHVSSLLTRM
jgi:hypothetical protein